jgi:hypothetical protein
MSSLIIPKGVRRHAARLFDQQMWCWGRDICSRHGNLLMKYGAEKQPAPDPKKGSTRYCIPLDDGSVLVLWGFALFIASPSGTGLYLRRYEFVPQVTAETGCWMEAWRPNQLVRMKLPHTDEQRCLACKLISDHAGTAHRNDCVASWWKKRIPAAEMVPRWKWIADEISRRNGVENPTTVSFARAIRAGHA